MKVTKICPDFKTECMMGACGAYNKRIYIIKYYDSKVEVKSDNRFGMKYNCHFSLKVRKVYHKCKKYGTILLLEVTEDEIDETRVKDFRTYSMNPLKCELSIEYYKHEKES